MNIDPTPNRRRRWWRFAGGCALTLVLQAIILGLLNTVEPSSGFFGNLGPAIHYLFFGQWVGYALAFVLLSNLEYDITEVQLVIYTSFGLLFASFLIYIYVVMPFLEQ